MTDRPTPSRPRRRAPLAGLRFAIAFLLGVALVVGAGGGALYAYGQQYTGRVLPGVSVGEADLSGLTPEAAAAALEDAYARLGAGISRSPAPTGELTIGYAEIGRGPDIAAMLDRRARRRPPGRARRGPHRGAADRDPRASTIDAAVTYDPAHSRRPSTAVAKALDRDPVDATLAVAEDGASVTHHLRRGARGGPAAALAAARRPVAEARRARRDPPGHPVHHRRRPPSRRPTPRPPRPPPTGWPRTSC